MKNLKLPYHVIKIIDTLIKNGFEAYAVGGCVRDILMGREPLDWDIATSATPADVENVFSNTVPTGIALGTVTVLLPQGKAEVTTFRTEGSYVDRRRPDRVDFITDIREDLSRRDFTINAMAYNDKIGLLDPFYGKKDIKSRLIRAVGNPFLRFSEDALRILRAFRFMAKLNFSIEEHTLEACKSEAESLRKISVERVAAEFCAILEVAEYLHVEALYKAKIIDAVIPEAMPFDPIRIHRAVSANSLAGKWAHLCGEKSLSALTRLKCSNALRRGAAELASYVGDDLKDYKKISAQLKYNTFEDLCLFLENSKALEKYLLAVKNGEPIRISDLCIGGHELTEEGIHGRKTGEVLSRLIEHVRIVPGDNNPKKIKFLLREWNYL